MVSTQANNRSPLLAFCEVSKRFGGTQAVDRVSFDVHPGEIVALLGENGAGKSTLIKLLAGIYPVDSGDIRFAGKPQAEWRSGDRARQPVAFIHQDLGLVEWMTVAENVALGMGYQRRFGLIDWRAARDAARRVMARVGCDIDPERRVFSLTRAEKSLLAIGRALEVQARVLVLDEPSASLPMTDVERLFTVLRGLRREGIAMIYVSHRLDEVMSISDRAAVMRDGKLVTVLETARTSETELVHLIVGKALSVSVPKAEPAPAPAPVLRLDDVASGNAGPVSFTVGRGEVVGLVGLRGAGHEAISRALFGREPLSAGRMTLLGQPACFRTSADAIRAGVAYVAGERLEENLAGSMSVLENLFPHPSLHGQGGFSLSRRRQENDTALALIRRFDVNPPAPAAEVQQLSGGNQQKVVLSKWRSGGSDIMLLDHPTRGLDIGAKEDVYEMIRDMSDDGVGVILVADTLEEAIGLSHSIIVLKDGAIQQRFDCKPGAKPSLFDLLHYMI